MRIEQPSRRPASKLTPLLRFLDVLSGIVLLIVIVSAGKLGHVPSAANDYLSLSLTVRDTVLICLFSLIWYLVAIMNVETSHKRLGRELRHGLIAAFAGTAFLALEAAPGRWLSIEQIAVFGISLSVVTATTHIMARRMEFLFYRKFAPQRSCLIVGSGPRAVAMYRVLKNSPYSRYNVLGFIDENGRHAVSDEIRGKVIGRLSDLKAMLKDTVVDEVFLALPVKSFYPQIQEAIYVCEEVGIECKLPSDLFSCSLARMRVEHDQHRPMLAMQVVRTDYTRLVKTAIDRAVAGVALTILAIPLALIAVAVALTSPGPVLFTQRRFGLNKRIFKMYKFRTMRVDAERLQSALEGSNEMGGPVFKIRHDPRVTPLGRWLRRASLDELPQLWNVLCGDMSLVGPRPLPVRDVSKFSEAWLMRRFSMKPGLTCLWQIGGRNNTTFERWMELDLEYIDRWSLWLDLEIILKTVPAVMRGEGAM